MSSKQILVCQYQSCLAQGSVEVLAAFLEQPVSDTSVIASPCQGQCSLGVTVRILPEGAWYCRVKPSDVDAIAHSHLQNDQPVDRLLHPRFHRTDSAS